MQDAAALIYRTLNGDAELIALLGGKIPAKSWQRIYNSPVAPMADEFPRITLFEVINDDAESADDDPQYSDVNVRIDVWLTDIRDLFNICKRIKKVLRPAFQCVRCDLKALCTKNQKLVKQFTTNP